ncbi:MAG: class I SAM-dependent methyltransferase [Chloroflexota bacterium]|nr:class I SAM-dependent methyltransferase [Chloroflexota bacterium]
MDSGMLTDLFSGTAEDYARFRPAYPEELLDDLRQRARVTGEGRLLDLACGPGRVALPLARHFGEVWAIDQEPEMIEVGRAGAERQGLTNIRWMVGRAEEVEAAPGSFELIAIGEAFHRLDQQLVAKGALEWLAPGCCLSTLGCFSPMVGQEPWHDVLRAAVRPWARSDVTTKLSSQQPSSRPRGADTERVVLTGHGFEHVGTFGFPHPHVWTVDSVLGNLRSTARFSRRALGHDVERFDAEVRRALLAFDSGNRYPETLRFGYSLFRRPIRPDGRV